MAQKLDEWDSYLCRVDDAPASIFLNMRYAEKHPRLGTLYAVTVAMFDPDEHGMGSREEASRFNALEDRFVAAASKAGFVPVGRLRNHGKWQLTFYGRADRDDEFAALARKRFARREVSFVSLRDPDWGYYHDFLYPSPERRQWMLDRDVVDALAKHGDRHEIARRVDHWIYFAKAAGRDAFVRAAAKAGFALEAKHPKHGAQIWRADPVEHEHIHEVVMTLQALAEKHGGDYDGWETSVEKS